jgi:FimV-like protein
VSFEYKKTMSKKTMSKKIALGLTLSYFCLVAHSAELGNLNILSEKSQPLKAELDLGALSALEVAALKIDLQSTNNTDLSAYGIKNSIEKHGNKYVVKISTQKPYPLNVLDIKVRADSNGQILEKSYSTILKTSEKFQVTGSNASNNQNKEIIQANPSPNKYLVKKGDTLTGIGSKHSTGLDNVSLDQVVAAIYRSNVGAFYNGNMNVLRAGSELSLPTSEDAASIDQRSAKLEIIARTSQYKKYRNKVTNFISKRAPEDQANTFKKGSVNTQAAKVEVTEANKDNLQIQKSSVNDKKEQEIAKELTTKEFKAAKEQADKIEADKQALNQKKNELAASAAVSSSADVASSVDNASAAAISSTNIQQDEKRDNPLGLTNNASGASSTDSTALQPEIKTNVDLTSTTEVDVKKKTSMGFWPFGLLLLGAGGIGYFAYSRHKKRHEQEDEYDSLFISNYKDQAVKSDKNNEVVDNQDNEQDQDMFNSMLMEKTLESQTLASVTTPKNEKTSNSNNIQAENKAEFDDSAFEGFFEENNIKDKIDISDVNLNVNVNNSASLNDVSASKNKLKEFADTINTSSDMVPSKKDVLSSIDDINFDDIPTLSMDDKIQEDNLKMPLAFDEDDDNNSNQQSKNSNTDDDSANFYETKLELAKAYLDIEDFSGAMMLLEELAGQSENIKVKKQAKSLIKEINNV